MRHLASNTWLPSGELPDGREQFSRSNCANEVYNVREGSLGLLAHRETRPESSLELILPKYQFSFQGQGVLALMVLDVR